jgi:transposase
MPEGRLPMRQIKEVLRLHHEAQLSERQIAGVCKIGKGTVQRYLERAGAAKLSWPLPEQLDDTQLEGLLFPPAAPSGDDPKQLPDFGAIHKELKSDRNVTLQLLWQEFKEQQPGGVNYSWFCEQCRDRITAPVKRPSSITPAIRST